MLKIMLATIVTVFILPVAAIAQEAAVVAQETAVTLTGASLWLAVAVAIVGCASTIAALFPKPAEGSFWFWPRKILDILAANILNAKNAP